MAKFKDNRGREWFPAFDVFLAERVRDRVGWDVDTCLDEGLKGLSELMRDSPRLVRVVYLLCEDDADKRGISPEDFGRALGGDALDAMRSAFLEAVADFCPPHQRKTLKALAAKGREVSARAAEAAIQELNAFDPFDSPTNSPASSDSAPSPEG